MIKQKYIVIGILAILVAAGGVKLSEYYLNQPSGPHSQTVTAEINYTETENGFNINWVTNRDANYLIGTLSSQNVSIEFMLKSINSSLKYNNSIVYVSQGHIIQNKNNTTIIEDPSFTGTIDITLRGVRVQNGERITTVLLSEEYT